MSEKMSITRALVEKKRLEDRIQREVSKFTPVVSIIGRDAVPSGFKSVGDYESKVKSQYQSIQDLIKRREAMTEAIVKSNSVTTVRVGDETLTVSQAIEKKNFYSTIFANYINTLRRFYVSAVKFNEDLSAAERSKANMEFEKFISRDKGIPEAEAKVIQQSIDARHDVRFVDPIELGKVIDDAETKMNEYLSNIDIILTESNSRTEIEF